MKALPKSLRKMIQKTSELFVLLHTLDIREYQIKLNKT